MELASKMSFKDFIKNPYFLIILGGILINLVLFYSLLGSIVYQLSFYLGIILLFAGSFILFERTKLNFALKTLIIAVLFLIIFIVPPYLLGGRPELSPLIYGPALIIVLFLSAIIPGTTQGGGSGIFSLEPTFLGWIVAIMVFVLYTWAVVALISWIILKIKNRKK